MKDDFKEQNKEDFTIISDNRSSDEFTYFIELKKNLELSTLGAKGYTEIYNIQFDKRNKEKYFQKDNLSNSIRKDINTKEINIEDKKGKAKEGEIVNIASGVYVMKFLLTEKSYIPNK